MRAVHKVIITQPNTSWFKKRQWMIPPYTFGLLAASVPDRFDLQILDPNLLQLTLEETVAAVDEAHVDLVALTCMSLEYARSMHALAEALKKSDPERTILLGGVYASTSPELAMADGFVDFAILGEGERRLPRILGMLADGQNDFAAFDGIAYRLDGKIHINPPQEIIEDLDELPFPDYDKVRMTSYFQSNHSFANVFNARYQPYAVSTTSRGCPYYCTYCSTHAIAGRRVRQRSAQNVLAEVDWLVQRYGIREIIFLDDNLNYKKSRFRQILEGLIERDYDLHWKSANLTTFLLDDELLELMKKSKCYQLILPIESGNQHVLDTILRKPLDLKIVPPIVKKGKELGFEIAIDFVIGSPGETWDQIRDSCRLADELDVDLVAFHIATVLPHTELYQRALDGGYLRSDFSFANSSFFGFGAGEITSPEFHPKDLQMLRALEWDRINFKTPEKKAKVAEMVGISLEELEKWRRNTIYNVGVYFPEAEGSDSEVQPTSSNALLEKSGRFARIVNA